MRLSIYPSIQLSSWERKYRIPEGGVQDFGVCGEANWSTSANEISVRKYFAE